MIVRNEEDRREFIADIGEEVLPEEYGGAAKLLLIQHFSLQTSDRDR